MMTDNVGFDPKDIKLEGMCKEATWYWMVTTLVLMSLGPAPKMDTLDDLKKAVSGFNDRVQGLNMDRLKEMMAHED
jgi:hypothetical protein